MEYTVRRYFSGFCTFHVEAKDADRAIETARQLEIDEEEIVSTLHDWRECDEVEEVNSE